MGGILALLYGVICYVVFFGSFLYAIAFVENAAQVPGLPDGLIPKTIDSGAPGALVPSLVIDAVLLSIFAIQHSVMARPAFKRVWTRIVPESVERSTYVLLASLALILVYWQWQPLPDAVWTVSNASVAMGLVIFSLIGWGIVLISTFLISHFELFGLAQVWARLRGEKVPLQTFKTPLFYRWVRHPIYLGFTIAFWSTPVMSEGHLLFAVATTAYMLIAIRFEEHDLIAHFGETYMVYRSRVSMILPLPKRGAK